jgi:hypothetical protein
VVRPERAFLVLGGIFALLFAGLTPPLGNPDEHVHLVRAYLVSEGRLAVPGRAPHARETMPRSLLALHRDLRHGDFRSAPRHFTFGEIRELADRPLRPRERIGVGFVGTYGPIAYAPQALAMWPGRMAGLGPLALLYLGRLGNVAAFLAAGWLALRLAPRRGLALALLMLLPISVSQAASLSADVPTHAVAFVFVALCWRLALAPGVRVEARDGVGLVACAALLGLAKPGYLLLVALVGVIPLERFGSRRRALRVVAATAAAMLLTTLLWTAVAVAADPSPAAPLANPGAQARHILAHPLHFMGVLARSLVAHLPGLVRTGVGVLGHLNIPLPGAVYLLAPAAIVGAILSDRPDPPQLSWGRRGFMLGLFAASVLLVLTMGYVGWNAPGAPLVLGIQGRYLAPLVPLLLLAVPALGGEARAAWRLWLRGACLLVAGGVLLVALLSVLEAFY